MAEEALRYKDKVTIVTGGSKGIGRGIVEVFVRSGSKVVITSNEEKEGRALAEELNKKGPGEAIFIFCDVTKEQNIKDLINKTVEHYGRIDCLVNNAGYHPVYMKIDETSRDDFRELVDLNLTSYFLAAKYALPHLRKTKGNIIQTASLSGTLGQAGSAPYCATKGAISSFTKSLAIDEAGNGVRINAFSPSCIRTPLVEELAEISGNAEKTLKQGSDIQLLGRLGTPEECGKACLFLAADATFCTGLDLGVTGGAELSYGVKNPLEKEPKCFF